MLEITTLGFPRIGKNRELKFLLESFWRKEVSEEGFVSRVEDLKIEHLRMQVDAGVDVVPIGDFSLYDTVLDFACMFGCVGNRFVFPEDYSQMQRYFAYARGDDRNPALEMTKWFNTNYHYIVPEVDGQFELKENFLLEDLKLAKRAFSNKKVKFKPIVMGIYTFLKLSKPKSQEQLIQWMKDLYPVWTEAVASLVDEGCDYIQIDEPALVYGEDKGAVKLLGRFYSELNDRFANQKFILQTYFDSIEEYFSQVIEWGFAYVGLDMVKGREANLNAISRTRIPNNLSFVLGVVDGRNVWKTDYSQVISVLKKVSKKIDINKAMISPSCSLLFVPYTVEGEEIGEVKPYLCFALEKLRELSDIKKIYRGNNSLLEKNKKLFSAWKKEEFRENKDVRKRLSSLKSRDFRRDLPFEKRFPLQKERLNLGLLPTTTIGSFPQTKELRKMRAMWRKKEISDLRYRVFIAQQIEKVIRFQEEIGLDILVHGEFERTDMVEYFGIQMKGFAFTKNGWVQSYGSRCIRPPIIYGDVWRPHPMTVDEVKFAQELTEKPVKGMLTGPVTILNWSFVRTDIDRKDVCYQIALALRDEVLDLERNGIGVIQVDEPALREGLPLKKKERKVYLNWAVKSFKLATSGVRPETQIHTHMCYSDFNDIIKAISEMDADVISIENARSRAELLDVFREFSYDKCIGPGVYDIHSSRVPSVEEMVELIELCLKRGIKKELLWVNPDCGLKTRDWPEVEASLRNMVKAAEIVRKKLA